MERAIERARDAAAENEVPVGAVLVRKGQMLAEGWNLTETHQDPTGHAEMVAIRLGSELTGSRRLADMTLYVTLEPCSMCAGGSFGPYPTYRLWCLRCKRRCLRNTAQYRPGPATES